MTSSTTTGYSLSLLRSVHTTLANDFAHVDFRALHRDLMEVNDLTLDYRLDQDGKLMSDSAPSNYWNISLKPRIQQVAIALDNVASRLIKFSRMHQRLKQYYRDEERFTAGVLWYIAFFVILVLIAMCGIIYVGIVSSAEINDGIVFITGVISVSLMILTMLGIWASVTTARKVDLASTSSGSARALLSDLDNYATYLGSDNIFIRVADAYSRGRPDEILKSTSDGKLEVRVERRVDVSGCEIDGTCGDSDETPGSGTQWNALTCSEASKFSNSWNCALNLCDTAKSFTEHLSDAFKQMYERALTTVDYVGVVTERVAAGARTLNTKNIDLIRDDMSLVVGITSSSGDAKKITTMLELGKVTSISKSTFAVTFQNPTNVDIPSDASLYVQYKSFTAQKCDRLLLGMLNTLADVQEGMPLDLHDSVSLWHGIQRGIDTLRGISERARDFDGGAASLNRSSALHVVRNDVVPLLKLMGAEVTTLVPTHAVREAFAASAPDAPRQRDNSTSTKSDCWLKCLQDDTCTWAYFSPGTGCVRSTGMCDGSGGPGCVSSTNHSHSRVAYVPASQQARDNASFLARSVITDAAAPQFVCSDSLATSSATSNLSQMDGVTRFETCAFENACGLMTGSNAYVTSGAGEGAASYASLLSVSSSTSGSNDTLNCVRTSPSQIYAAHTATGLAATFNSVAPDIIQQIVSTSRRSNHEVRLEKYVDFIHDELLAYYGDVYDAQLRPRVDGVLSEVSKIVQKERNVKDAHVWLGVARFSEKLDALKPVERTELTRVVGQLSLFTSTYASRFPMRSSLPVATDIASVGVASFFTLVGLVLIIYWTRLITCNSRGTCSRSHLINSLIISFATAMVLCSLVLAATRRWHAQRKYDQTIMIENAQELVARSSRLMDRLSRQTEVKLLGKGGSSPASVTACVEMRRMYEALKYGRGLRRLQCDGKDPVTGAVVARVEDAGRTLPEPTAQQLYDDVISTIKAFDRCNTIVSHIPKPTFPWSEIMIYGVSMVIVVGITLVIWAELNVSECIGRIKYLWPQYKRLSQGMPPTMSNLDLFLETAAPSPHTTQVIMTVFALLVIMTAVYLVFVVSRSTSNYGNSLFASSLYIKHECINNGRK